MPDIVSPVLRRPPRKHRSHPQQLAVAPPVGESPAYGRSFWMAHLANTLLLSGVGILFRYADFVTTLGGDEFHIGWIVGLGMVGSFFMRLFIGAWIDRYGARPLWIGSLALFIGTCLAHLCVTSCTGPTIYVLRICYCCATAGVNGASMTFVGGRAPEKRLAEMVGMLGTAGFVGSVVGTLASDGVFFFTPNDPRFRVDLLFLIAAAFGASALPFAWAATRFERRRSPATPSPTDRTSLWTLLCRYYPGAVFVVGTAMGVGLGMPSTFLRTYAADLGIPRIGLFFLVYAVSAIITRIVTRTWFARFGTRHMIVLGMGGMVASLLMLLPVAKEWHLALPAVLFGCSQAILFPAIVAAGAVAFPPANRGLATVLVLATWDAGLLIGAPTIGGLLRGSERLGLPRYPTMLVTLSLLLALVGLWYVWTTRKTN
jgi:MFS family permease